MNNLTIITIILLSTLISCGKSETIKEPKTFTKLENMQKSITDALLIDMNDPSTFEFVSIEVYKTFTVGERKEVINEEKLKRILELDQGGELMIPQVTQEIVFLSDKEDNIEAVYYVRFKARGSNKFGGIVLSTYSAVVLNDKDLTVVNLESFN